MILESCYWNSVIEILLLEFCYWNHEGGKASAVHIDIGILLLEYWNHEGFCNVATQVFNKVESEYFSH